MSTRRDPGDEAARTARRLVADLCAELRDARQAAGVSLEQAARLAGLSSSQLSRLERNELTDVTFVQLWRAAAPLGLRPFARLYPAGSPVRDRAHLALLARLESVLGGGIAMLREVPLPIRGDLRAWDAMLMARGRRTFVEGETRLSDLQALERRLRLKLRDDGRDATLILLVARGEHNRAVLAEHRHALREFLPLDGAAILRSLRAGTCPPASGILIR